MMTRCFPSQPRPTQLTTFETSLLSRPTGPYSLAIVISSEQCPKLAAMSNDKPLCCDRLYGKGQTLPSQSPATSLSFPNLTEGVHTYRSRHPASPPAGPIHPSPRRPLMTGLPSLLVLRDAQGVTMQRLCGLTLASRARLTSRKWVRDPQPAWG